MSNSTSEHFHCPIYSKYNYFIYPYLLIAVAFFIIGSISAQAAPPPGTGNWTLTFEDNFDGSSLDTSIWNTGQRHNAAINGEPQAYRPEAVTVANGVCTITASKFSGFIKNSGGYPAGATTISVDGFPGAIPDGAIIYVNNADMVTSGAMHNGPSYTVLSTVGGSNPSQITIEPRPFNHDNDSDTDTQTIGPGLQFAAPDNAPVYVTFKMQNMDGPVHEWGRFPYRSGMIQTYDKWTQAYGYFEARVKMPSAPGTWPAFWLLPDRGPSSQNVYERTTVGDYWKIKNDGVIVDSGNMPMGNEIDIFEYMAAWKDPATNLSSSHSGYFWDYNGGSMGDFTAPFELLNPDTEFHTYGVAWGPDELRFYIDGRPVFSNGGMGNVGETPHYMLLNMAMSINDWSPQPDPDRLTEIDPSLPGEMVIDYVRVWSGDLGAGASSGDLGNVGLAGDHAFNADTLTVQASGDDIEGNQDSFHFVGQEYLGDGSLTIQLESLSNTNADTKAGLMFREYQDDSSSRHVFLGKLPNGDVSLYYRSSTGGATSMTSPVSASLPGWLRLTRSGNSFTGFISDNGLDWTSIGSVSVPMSEAIFAGVATTSGNNSALTTAVYKDFQPTISFESSNLADNPWLGQGSAAVSNDVYTLQGVGDGWLYGSGKGHYAYQRISGDCVITARVTSITGGDQYSATAGVMMRDDLALDARTVATNITPFSTRVLHYRSETEGAPFSSSISDSARPEWVRLERVGDVFTGYVSEDGVNWSEIDSVTLEDSNELMYIGIAVNSNNTEASTAVFENVSINDWGSTNIGGDEPVEILQEVETLPIADSSGTVDTYYKSYVSGGYYDVLTPTQAGDYVTYTVPSVPAATYSIEVGVYKYSTRGLFQLSIDGVNQGSYQDQYSSTGVVDALDLGLVTFNSFGDHAFTFTAIGPSGGSEMKVSIDYIKLTLVSDGSGSPVLYEVEDIVGEIASDSVTEHSDGQASGGKLRKLNADAVNDYVTYSILDVPGGEYLVKVGVKTYSSRGQFQLKINGSNQGAVQDQYAASSSFEELDLGSRVFSSGSHDFEFVVVGKNASSSGYSLVFDYIRLEPVGGGSGGIEVIMDSEDSTGVSTNGNWSASTYTSGYMGGNYLHDGNNSQGSKSVTYTPQLTAAGNYEIFLRWTSGNNRADNVPVDIVLSSGSLASATVDQTVDNGQWVSIGTYMLSPSNAALTINNTGANGFVIADGVRFSPSP